jgi:ferric-dicitrate binding protein FerR (iron transport regulator)
MDLLSIYNMKYKDYDIGHFITDEFFIQWIKNPTENNSHFWEKWIELHPEKRTLVNEAANLIRPVKYTNNPEFTDKMYVEIFERILKADNHFQELYPLSHTKISTTPTKKVNSFFPVRGIAASLLVLFCLYAQYEAFNYKPELVEIPEVALITRSNPAGQKSSIDLPDGTKIHLNAESEIEFPQEFSADIRLVSLKKGEAFFEVQKELRPFLVQSGNAKIRVLGTSFNVKKIGNESLQVALVTGKVSVDTENGSRMRLEPNEMLVLEDGGAFQKTGFDSKEVVGWKDNYLIFKTSSLSEVKRKLELWYGVNIELKGDFDQEWTYSGIYKDEMLENVLRGISMTSAINYKIDKKQITITNPK